MTRVFVDTSAILALLVPTDAAHARAKRAFERLRAEERPLLTTSYVLLEVYALVGGRLGRAAARSFREEFAPLLEIAWIDRDRHERALDRWLGPSGRELSLVDAASFVVMGDEGLDASFAYDHDFERAGFEVVT